MLSFLHKTIRAFLIITAIVVFGWLSVKAITPGGRLAAAYNMEKESPFISKLYPKNRVSEILRDADNAAYRKLLAEPVYFDLAPNDRFEQIAVSIKYKNIGQPPLKFGGLINKGSWAFDFRELPPTGAEPRTITEIFDFSKLAPEGRKYRFGFSAPGLRAGDAEIFKIEALFTRKPLTEKEAANKILDAIVRRLNIIFGSQ
jgi:hypothetical protein